MNSQQIIVYIIIAVCVILAANWCYKQLTRKKGDGCGCGCSGCTASSKNGKKTSGCSSRNDNNRTCC